MISILANKRYEGAMMTSAQRKPKPYKGIAMEGMIATWYAKNTGKSIAEFSKLAKHIADSLRPGDHVLEVAPGPGYLAIALAQLGSYRIVGLDISRSFVRIARDNATRNRVDVDFQEGDAAAMPFAAEAFDCVVCRAAFKNFSDPVGALAEMHRVLRPRGRALIVDMRKDASNRSITDEVAKMNLGSIDAFITRMTLSALRKRAYSRPDFERMLEATPFDRSDIREQPLGFEIELIR
jgi:ubiquinone/menaquinone biosynthesis C-methylase UbiE